MVTASTVPVLVLIAVLWRITRGQVLPIVVFASAFSAASAINLGLLGIQPWLLALILCIFVKVAVGIRKPRLPDGVNVAALLLMFLFVLYAVGSAIIEPYLFKGVTVVRSSLISSLTWGTSNLAQSFYLCTAAVVYVITISRPMKQLEEVLEWYIRACIAASCVAMYQLANAVMHIPYPNTVLYSNPSYAIYSAYKINGMWRLNGPFCEASEMAGFLIVGVALLSWELLTRPVRARRVAYLVLIAFALLMTLSSLGYVCLIAISAVAIVMFGFSVFKRGASRIRVVVVLAIIGSSITFFTLSKSAVQTVDKIVTSTLLKKTTTDSYKERTETHRYALQTLADTDYLGAGWGSLRASGLAYILLGTVGIPGTALFAAFYLSLYRPMLYRPVSAVRGSGSSLLYRDGKNLYARSMFAGTMLLFSMLIAGSEPVTPILWVLFGIAAAVQPHKTRHSFPGVRSYESSNAQIPLVVPTIPAPTKLVAR